MWVWEHDDKLYRVMSLYNLSEDAWQYELVEQTEPLERGACLAVVIPDATPVGGPFTPKHADHALFGGSPGVTPWRILRRFIDLVESSGYIVGADRAHVTSDDGISSDSVWSHAGKRFEMDSFHAKERATWCYELKPNESPNEYVEVRIPDANPDAGRFVPGPSDRVTFTVHSERDIPWPVFRRFIEVVAVSGHIVEEQPA